MNAIRKRAQEGFVLPAAVILSVAMLLVGCERPLEPEVEMSEPLAIGEMEPLFNENGVYIAHGNGKGLFTAELDEGGHAVCVNAPERTGGHGYWVNSLVQVTVRRGGDGPNFALYTPSLDMFTSTQILAAGSGTTTFEVKGDDPIRWLIRVEALDRHRELGGCPPLAVAQ